MLTYGQFCPVAQALELVGERWTLLIIRELMCGNYRFGQILNGVPLMSRSLLAQRLRALEEAGLVERHTGNKAGNKPGNKAGNKADNQAVGITYQLTDAARELEPIVMGLGAWGQRWAQRKVHETDLDPVLLMWDLHRNLVLERLPSEETVVKFWFRDVEAKRSRYWLRIQRPEVELCMTNPGFTETLQVETTLRVLVEVWMGHRALAQALRDGEIRVQGPAALVRAFPKWLKLNVFAGVPRAAAGLPR